MIEEIRRLSKERTATSPAGFRRYQALYRLADLAEALAHKYQRDVNMLVDALANERRKVIDLEKVDTSQVPETDTE